MTTQELHRRLAEQGWRCCYPCAANGRDGAPIRPGEPVALCYDGHGICHLHCAVVNSEDELPVILRNHDRQKLAVGGLCSFLGLLLGILGLFLDYWFISIALVIVVAIGLLALVNMEYE